ncbi:MAG: glycosyltransferase family 39 protein, partial [Pirellulales bacterium]
MSKRLTHSAKAPPRNVETSAAPRNRLVLLVIVALAVRAIYFLQYRGSPLDGYHIVDQRYYLEWVRQIAAGDWLGREVFEQGPLYPYLLGGVFATLGERLNLILTAQLALGLGVVLLTYAAGRRLFDDTTALVAGLVAAVYGPLVFYDCMILKSFLEPAATLVALYALLRHRDSGRWQWLCGAGVAIGLACLLRESHVLLAIPAAAAVACGPTPHTVPRTPWDRLRPVVVLAVSVALPIIPVTLRNYRVGGEWVWVTAGGGEVFYMGHGPAATGYYSPPDFITARPPLEHEDFRREAQRRSGQVMSRGQSSRFWFHEGLRAMAANPGRTVWLTFAKASVLLNDFEVPDSESYQLSRQFVPILRVLPSFGWIVGCGLLGLALCLRQWRRYGLLLGFVAAYVAPVLLLYNFGRFRIGLMPL